MTRSFVNVCYEILLFDVHRWQVRQGREQLPRNRDVPQVLSAEIDTEEALIADATQATELMMSDPRYRFPLAD